MKVIDGLILTLGIFISAIALFSRRSPDEEYNDRYNEDYTIYLRNYDLIRSYDDCYQERLINTISFLNLHITEVFYQSNPRIYFHAVHEVKSYLLSCHLHISSGRMDYHLEVKLAEVIKYTQEILDRQDISIDA